MIVKRKSFSEEDKKKKKAKKIAVGAGLTAAGLIGLGALAANGKLDFVDNKISGKANTAIYDAADKLGDSDLTRKIKRDAVNRQIRNTSKNLRDHIEDFLINGGKQENNS